MNSRLAHRIDCTQPLQCTAWRAHGHSYDTLEHDTAAQGSRRLPCQGALAALPSVCPGSVASHSPCWDLPGAEMRLAHSPKGCPAPSQQLRAAADLPAQGNGSVKRYRLLLQHHLGLWSRVQHADIISEVYGLKMQSLGRSVHLHPAVGLYLEPSAQGCGSFYPPVPGQRQVVRVRSAKARLSIRQAGARAGPHCGPWLL